MIPRYSINYKFRDMVNTVHQVYSGSKCVNSTEKEDKKHIYAMSGSSALRFILRNLGLQRGDKIAIPLLTCERAIYAIISEGFIPVFVDISNHELYSTSEDYLNAAKNDDVKAIIAISMWGYPVNVNEITKHLDPTIPVIHDCALSIGSKINNIDDGLNSPFAFYSYGIGKPICYGFGGKAVINNSDKYTELTTKSYQGRKTEIISRSLRSLLKAFLFRGGIYWVPYFINELSKTDGHKLGHLESLAMIQENLFLNMSQKIKELDLMISKASKNILPISETFEKFGYKTIKENLDVKWNYWMYPVLAPDGIDPEIIRRKMSAQGFEIGLPYRRTIQLAEKFWGYQGSCANIEKKLPRMFLIPSPHQFSKKSLMKFIQAISLISDNSYANY